MKKYSLLFLLLFFASFSVALAQTPCEKITIDGKQYYLYMPNSREMLSDIAKKFNISKDELLENNYLVAKRGLRKKETLKIPVKEGLDNPCEKFATVKSEQVAEPEPEPQPSFQRPARKKTLKVAYLMPFALNESDSNPNNDRFMEFYQGSLLAVEKLKNEGASFEIYAYDTGTNAMLLSSILSKPELREMDMIIGPVYTAQVKKVSEYTKRFGIKHIVPFSAQTSETMSNPMIFQCNIPSIQQAEVAARRFAQVFKEQPIAIVEFNDSQEGLNKAIHLITALKRELHYNAVPFQSVVYDGTNLSEKIHSLTDDNETIVVLGTIDVGMLSDAISQLRASDKNFALFGIPEWQTMVNGVQENIFSCKLYLYAPFHIDNLNADAIQFRQNFTNAFGTYNQSSLPFYNFYGYDVSLYFLSAWERYGNGFPSQLSSFTVNTLQSYFRFERVNSQGGYENNGLFLLKYTPDEPVVRQPF